MQKIIILSQRLNWSFLKNSYTNKKAFTFICNFRCRCNIIPQTKSVELGRIRKHTKNPLLFCQFNHFVEKTDRTVTEMWQLCCEILGFGNYIFVKMSETCLCLFNSLFICHSTFHLSTTNVNGNWVNVQTDSFTDFDDF